MLISRENKWACHVPNGVPLVSPSHSTKILSSAQVIIHESFLFSPSLYLFSPQQFISPFFATHCPVEGHELLLQLVTIGTELLGTFLHVSQ